MLNESFNTTPAPDLQSGVPTVRELLKDAQLHLAETKLRLCRARNQTHAGNSRAVIGRLCQGCDSAILALDTLTSGGGGAL